MKIKIMVFITFSLIAIFSISQSPLYAESTESGGTIATGNDNNITTFIKKLFDRVKAGLRIEGERIPNAVQETDDINRFTSFMESYSPYEYGVTIIDPLAGQNRSKAYGKRGSQTRVGPC